MAPQQWEVEPTTGRCAQTGDPLAEGDEFYTVLFEDGDSFRRVDYAVAAWTGVPDGAFCHFKSRVPVKEKRKRLLVDNDVLANFFVRLADETEEVRVQFRFVLALILMRKRLVRYEGSTTADGVETWEVVLTRDHTTHRVVNPRLTDDQIEGVSKQLTAILHGDMGEFVDEQDENTVDPPVGEEGSHDES